MLRQTYKNYTLVGRLLFISNPAEAEALLTKYAHLDEDADLTLIPGYFATFCDINGLSPNDYRGKLYNRERVEMRKLFVSCMVKIYRKELFNDNPKKSIMPNGFFRRISEELQIKESTTCAIVQTAIIHEKVYDDYRLKVENLTASLLQYTSAG